MDVCSLFQSATEHPQPLNIPVQGTLPDWFQGTYYSVGNGLFDLPGGFTVNHSYDGFAILYSIRVTDKTQVSVRSKFLDSDAYKRAIATGKPVFNEFGTMAFPDPNKGLFSRMMSQLVPFAFTDNDSMNLTVIKGGLFALTETCFMHQLSPDTLSSIQKVDLLKTYGYGYMSAHPLHDDDGSTYCVTYSFSTGLKYNIVQFLPPASKRDTNLNETNNLSPMDVRVLATVSSSWKTCFGYIHSFALTPTYFILYEQPFLLNNLKLLTSQVQGRAPKQSFEWHPDEKTTFILVDRLTGEVVETKYLSPPFFITHVVNAYEEDEHIVLDLIGRKSTAIVENLVLKNLRENSFCPNDPPRLYRFVLPLVKQVSKLISEENLVKLKGTQATAILTKQGVLCTPVTIGEPGFDFPTINTKLTGKKYRFLYGTGYFEEGYYRRAICKLDLLTERTQLIRFEDTQCSSEPLFVSRPDASAEDDGLVIASLAETRTNHPSAIIFVDAATFQEVGRVNIPYKIAHIQHGIFLPMIENEDNKKKNHK